MTLSEQNILIAKFMGFELIRVGYVGQNDGDVDDETDWQRENDRWLDEVGISSVGRYIVNVPEKKWFLWEDVRYDESWEWLMPVGEKIFEYLQKAVKERPPHTCTEGDLIEVDITCAIREYNRPEAYKHIVRWIQWYNKQNTSPI